MYDSKDGISPYWLVSLFSGIVFHAIAPLQQLQIANNCPNGGFGLVDYASQTRLQLGVNLKGVCSRVTL
ncbi:hypothetical protein BDW60DRAFT_176830, partial [Aspergillus nidulans var. acristatus]